MKKLSFQHVVILFLTAVFCVSLHVQPQTASAQEDSSQQRLVDRAENTFNDFMGDEKMTWLQRNYPDAKGLIIIPRQLKGGFFIGGSRGSGVLVVGNHETGQCSQPGF